MTTKELAFATSTIWVVLAAILFEPLHEALRGAPWVARGAAYACGIFAVEFVWRWRRSGMGWRFLRSYWYEVLGMVPLSDPAFRSFRLLRIVIILARLGREDD